MQVAKSNLKILVFLVQGVLLPSASGQKTGLPQIERISRQGEVRMSLGVNVC